MCYTVGHHINAVKVNGTFNFCEKSRHFRHDQSYTDALIIINPLFLNQYIKSSLKQQKRKIKSSSKCKEAMAIKY